MKIYYFDQSNTGMGHIPVSTLAADYSYNVTLSGDLLSLDSIQTPHLDFTLGQKYLFTQNDSTNAGYKLTFPYYDFSSQLWTDSTLGITPHGVPCYKINWTFSRKSIQLFFIERMFSIKKEFTEKTPPPFPNDNSENYHFVTPIYNSITITTSLYKPIKIQDGQYTK